MIPQQRVFFPVPNYVYIILHIYRIMEIHLFELVGEQIVHKTREFLRFSPLPIIFNSNNKSLRSDKWIQYKGL